MGATSPVRTRVKPRFNNNRQYHPPEPREEEDDVPKMIYEMPLMTSWLDKHDWAKFIPFLHTFDEDIFSIRKKKAVRKEKKRRKQQDAEYGRVTDNGEQATTSV